MVTLYQPAKFDMGAFIDDQNKQINQETRKSVKQDDFRALIDLFDEEWQEEYKLLSDDEKDNHLKLQHDAILGVAYAVQIIEDKIRDFILLRGLSKTDFPKYYKDLSDAVFHERFGFGPLATWANYPDSESAQIIGTDIYYTYKNGKHLQKEKFENVERVYEICNALMMKDSQARLNDKKPYLEIDMYDGTRVSIVIPPRSQVPVLTFRRFVVKEFSLDYVAKRGTIPVEAIPVFRALARCRVNTVISGPMRSAKTSMLKTLFAERKDNETTILIEKIFELFLRRDFPERAIIELQADEQDLTTNLFASTLRHDGTCFVIGEVRSIEADIFLQGCERALPGCMCTYHSPDALNVIGRFARHIVDTYPGRSYRQEMIRAADLIDYVITMEELDDLTRVVTGVQEVQLDPFTYEVSTVSLMEFDFDHRTWRYNAEGLSSVLFKRMKKYDRQAALEFEKVLRELSQLNPIQGDARRVSLETRGFTS